jgi:hypothetical protein
MPDNHKTVQYYAERKTNHREGDRVIWRGSGRSTIFAENDILYSYGYHFPLALHLGAVKEKHIFVKNGDFYSATTRGHQADTQRHCAGPTISITALRAAGIEFSGLTMHQKAMKGFKPNDRKGTAIILFYQPDSSTSVTYNCHTKRYTIKETYDDKGKRWTPPNTGMFVPYSRTPESNGDTDGYWHIVGAVVIEKGGKHYLCSMDERNYFVAELNRKVKSIKDAFNSLKPDPVLRAERDGKKVLRQGEWFFVETSLTTDELAKKNRTTKTEIKSSKITALPQDFWSKIDGSPREHQHAAKWVSCGHIYVTGTVYHRFAGTTLGTGEHKPLDLGEKWYKAYVNTEVASWSNNGKMD